MLNIGFIAHNHFPRLGGMEYCTHFLAENLNKLDDVNASVACGSLRGIPLDFKYSYPCYRAKSFTVFTPWLFKKNREFMVRSESINLLHGQMLHGGGFDAMLLSQKFKLPFVAQSHGADVQMVSHIMYGALYDETNKVKIKKVINQADRLIAVSSMNKQNMIDLGAKPEQIEIIHNGVDIKGIDQIKVENLRPIWNVSEEDFILISVGRNRPIKRMELLFKTLSKLKDFKKIKCVCIGPELGLSKLITKYNLADKVILAGKIPKSQNLNLHPPYDDLINSYKSSNLYVSTSYLESFGIATAEALACGLPVVIGSNHGIKDVIKEGMTGWVMPEETPDSLAGLILDLYEKRETLKSNSISIKQSIKHLSWGTISKQMTDVYKNIL